VLPRAVVYDPELTRSLPVGISVASALNAVAHAVEALYAPDGSPVIALMAEEASARWAARSARSLGIPGSLAELGLTEADVERAVALATVDPYANPAPVTGDGIRTLLLAALRGEDV
jgi:alcohol dehydrogenase class IV